jgi:phosphoribosylaminoimidazole carboxylase PurE protein
MAGSNPLVLILMGSKSDLEVMTKASAQLDAFGIPYEVEISSAHRNPARTTELSSTAASRGIRVIIAGAGLAAALPGVVAAHTQLPVIGVPLVSGALNGVDSLYSIVQMPPGIPVATVGIGNAKNAAILAVQMLALADEEIAGKLAEFRAEQSK